MLKTDASDNYVGSLHIWKAIWEIREQLCHPVLIYYLLSSK